MRKYLLKKTTKNLLRAEPLPNQDELQKHYETKYFQETTSLAYAHEYSDEELQYHNFKDKLIQAALEKYNTIKTWKNTTVLDLGCGEGFSAKYFHNLGCDVYAVDFSNAGIEKHNKTLLKAISFTQADIIHDDFYPSKRFDLIIMHHVLEHVIDIEKTIKKIKNKLQPNGHIAVTVPNEFNPLQEEFLNRKIFAPQDAPWFAPPEHLTYFSPQTLKQVFFENGFDCFTLMGNFPIDMFLLTPETDYYSIAFGKTAHKIRMKFSNLIIKKPSKAVTLCESLIDLELGRDILGIFCITHEKTE